MRNYLSILLLVFLTTNASQAQYGINAGFVSANTPEWNAFMNQVGPSSDFAVLNQGFHIGIDYWFKMLKDYRIEAMPELSYSRIDSRFDDQTTVSFVSDKISLHFNTNIYLFNMESDCNCPTFSKDGPSLQKGFFLRIGPGVSYHDHFADGRLEGSEVSLRSNEVVFDLRLGVGIDFGISDFLTITPIIQADRVFSSEYEGLNTVTMEDLDFDNRSVFDKFFFGMRVGLRFDELNKYGYR